MMQASEKYLGKTITNFGLRYIYFRIRRHTLFAHFCGGEERADLNETIVKLASHNIGGILGKLKHIVVDYAAEVKLADLKPKRERTSAKSLRFLIFVREYDPLISEEECDENKQKAALDGATKFVAIKPSGLGRANTFRKVTKVIHQTMNLYEKFDKDNSGDIDFSEFCSGLESMKIEISKEKAQELFDEVDQKKTGRIPLLKWIEYLRIEDLDHRNFFCSKTSLIDTLSEGEMQAYYRFYDRVREICELCQELNVKVFVDAEYVWCQGSYDHITMQLQREFNKTNPIIFNTYQAYLKDSHKRLMIDLDRADEEGFIFACKLVRGAYMDTERSEAREGKYPSPIYDTINDTHENYNAILHHLIDRAAKDGKTEIMVATHNQASIEKAAELIDDHKLCRKTSGIHFAQLLGMADHLSVGLANADFSIFKYVPYGPVDECAAYLLRRTKENSDVISGGVAHELKLLRAALKKRFLALLGL